MVLPVLPLVATGLAGALGGSLASNSLTKKGSVDSHNYTDSRQIDITYPVYQVQIDSPAASQTTKKESAQSIEPTNSTGSGIDFSQLMPVALVIGGALVVKELIK